MILSRCQREVGFRESLFLLSALYIIQGAFLGFLSSAEFIFQKKGATLSDQSLLSIINFPWFFKFLLAPIVDKFFIKDIGRRKSYIVPTNLILGISYILLSFFCQNMFDHLSIGLFTIIGTLLSLVLIINDISNDAFGNSLFKGNDLKYVATSEIGGQVFGLLIGFNFFTCLNSIEFLNEHFYKTPGNEPLVTVGQFLFILGVLSITMSVYLLILVKEPVLVTQELKSIGEAYSLLLAFWKNKNIRNLLLWRALYFTGQSTIAATLPFILITNGYLKSTLALINIPQTIVQLFGIILASKVVGAGRFYTASTILIILNTIFLSLFLIPYKIYIDGGSYSTVTILLLIFGIFSSFLDQHDYFDSAFVSQNAEPAVATTFKTGIYSFYNFSILVPRTISLKIVIYFPYYAFVGVGLGFQLIYLIATLKCAFFFDNIKPEGYLLREKHEIPLTPGCQTEVEPSKVNDNPIETEMTNVDNPIQNKFSIEKNKKSKKQMNKISSFSEVYANKQRSTFQFKSNQLIFFFPSKSIPVNVQKNVQTYSIDQIPIRIPLLINEIPYTLFNMATV